MFAIMSFQRVRRLRVLKFLWLEDSWVRRKVPPLTTLCTKANNAKKPVRYTSIKKAKPKTIIDIARLLQQKTKETKERTQSVIPAAAMKAATSSTTKPATPNQFNEQSDAKAILVSNGKVQTSTSTLPANVSVEGSSESLDTKPVQHIIDVEAGLNAASKLHVAASRTFCETAPDTAIIDSAVDFAYSKGVDQIAVGGLHNKTYTEITNAKDAAPKAVDSGVESPTSNAPQEPSAQGEVSELSSTNTKEVIPSSEGVCSEFKKLTPEVIVSDEMVNMPEVMVTSKVMATPEVSSAHGDDHLEESFTASEVVTVTNVSTFVNTAQAQCFSQPQSTQSQDFIAPNCSSNVNADKTPPSQEIINQAFGSFPAESIMDISSAEAVAVACGEVPSLCEVCHEEAILVSYTIPEVYLFKSTEDLPVVETISASLSKAVKADGMSEMSGDAQSSINLKEPIVAQTDVLEEEVQKEAFEEFPEAQLDPIKRLFLDKIWEYSTKSQASGGLVDVGPEYEKVFTEELTKLQRLYGGGDLSKFPEFKFSEPVLDENSSK